MNEPTQSIRNMTLFLDAMNYSFQMVLFQKEDVDRILPILEKTESIEGEYETYAIRLIQTLWGIIDTGHRVRELVQQIPGLKKNSPEIQLFIRNTRSVEELRHYIQHLRHGIHALPEKSSPLWGVISWVSKSYEETCFTLLTGSAPDISVHTCSYDTCKNEFAQRLILSVNKHTVEIYQLVEQIDCLKGFILKWAEKQGYSFEKKRLPIFRFDVPRNIFVQSDSLEG